MHIVFVTIELATENNSSGGLASFTANMARIFSSHGHKVSIILVGTKEEKLTFDKGIDLQVLYVEMDKWERMDKAAQELFQIYDESQDEIRRTFINLYKSIKVEQIIAKINKENKIDIVHYCNHGSLNLLADKNIPYVVRISGFLNIWNNGASVPNGSLEYHDNPLTIKQKLEEYTIKRAKNVICPSNLLSDICKKNLGINAVVLESPFVLNKMSWDYSVYNDCCIEGEYIIHYGTQSCLKGTHIVAQVVYEVLKKHKNINFVLIGADKNLQDADGTIYKAKELVKKRAKEYGDRVVCLDKLPREQLYPFIENASICLLPSRMDNLPNACIEAMAMGKIVVGTNGASFEQLITDGVNGFLGERDNADSYIISIERVITLSEEAKKNISENAKRTVERLSPENIYNKYINYYRKVIQEWQWNTEKDIV